MDKKRILFVTQEIEPYTTITAISSLMKELTMQTHKNSFEIRILMPKFGLINERRHRLHEVVRLSGMNIIIDDDDFPLIIKVASLPDSRIQVYFLDNEEFFKRKFMFRDEEGDLFEDNDSRMVFFCKGVLETVKKFGWAPDIVHVHGWMSSMVPLYLKKVYKDDPIYQDAKVVLSVYDNPCNIKLAPNFVEKAMINDLNPEDLEEYFEDGEVFLNKGAIINSDAIIQGSHFANENVLKLMSEQGKPFLAYNEENHVPEIIKFYKSLLKD
jgi:starch synthase